MVIDTLSSEHNSGAQQSAAPSKGNWNRLLFPLAIAGISACWYCAIQLLLGFRMQFFPQDAFLMNGTRLGNILMYVSPGFPSLGIGLLLANLVVWMIPSARRALEEEARGAAQSDFKSSILGIARLTILFSAIAFPVAVFGATSYFYLTLQSIVYRPSLLSRERHYNWSDLESIETACWYRGTRRDDSYALVMNDGTRVGILESPRDFLKAYPIFTSALTGHSFVFSSSEVEPRCDGSLPPMLRKVLTIAPALSEKTR